MLLKSTGVLASDLASHSQRKGGLTFLATASTAGPNPIAIAIRAGWSLGQVLGRYIKEGMYKMYQCVQLSVRFLSKTPLSLEPGRTNQKQKEI